MVQNFVIFDHLPPCKVSQLDHTWTRKNRQNWYVSGTFWYICHYSSKPPKPLRFSAIHSDFCKCKLCKLPAKKSAISCDFGIKSVYFGTFCNSLIYPVHRFLIWSIVQLDQACPAHTWSSFGQLLVKLIRVNILAKNVKIISDVYAYQFTSCVLHQTFFQSQCQVDQFVSWQFCQLICVNPPA